MVATARTKRTHPLLAGCLVALLLAAIAFSGWRIVAEMNARAHWSKALAALDAEDFAAAREELTPCLRAWPTSAETHFVAARAARRDGQFPEALRLLKSAEKLNWVPEAIDLERILVSVSTGSQQEEENLLAGLVQRDHPDKRLILEVLVPAYLRNFQIAEARRLADLWTELAPQSAAAFECLGTVTRRQRNSKAAVAAYQRAVELKPEARRQRFELIRLLLEANQSAEALEHVTYLQQQTPQDILVKRELACCLSLQGETDKARNLFDEVLAVQPDDIEALAERGRIALRRNDATEAEQFLARAAQKASHDRSVVYPYVRALRLNNKVEEARRWEDRLTRAMADRDRLEKATQAAAASRTDPEPRYEAGVIFLRNGQDDEGVRWLASALRLAPDHPGTHRELADYYERKGQREIAAAHRSKAQRKEQSPPPKRNTP